jgi:PHD/YefM family antitoxin component YafN of YafNO toxin-antitoxin module
MSSHNSPMTSSETGPLRVPISAAAARGISWLNEQAAVRRVALTKYGRPVAVIDSAERLEETARLVRETRREVVEQMCEVAAGRAGQTHTLDTVCERLGIDLGRVHERARQLAG